MSDTPTVTESQVMTALRSYLLTILPQGTEIVQSEDNRVPEPEGDTFIVLNPLTRLRLSTNKTSYMDDSPSNTHTRTDVAATEFTINVDVHGPDSGDLVQVISTLFRSDVATDWFASNSTCIQPLYTSDPRQTGFNNSEQQVERRWGIDLVMQANMAVVTTQQFFSDVEIGLINVDVTYPPGA